MLLLALSQPKRPKSMRGGGGGGLTDVHVVCQNGNDRRYPSLYLAKEADIAQNHSATFISSSNI